MNIAQIALLAIKQSTKNTELSQAHSNITKKQQPKPLETFKSNAGTRRERQARWREGQGQRREERGWQAPGPGLGAARGSMRASGRASAASCSRHLAQLREGRIFGGLQHPTASIDGSG